MQRYIIIQPTFLQSKSETEWIQALLNLRYNTSTGSISWTRKWQKRNDSIQALNEKNRVSLKTVIAFILTIHLRATEWPSFHTHKATPNGTSGLRSRGLRDRHYFDAYRVCLNTAICWRFKDASSPGGSFQACRLKHVTLNKPPSETAGMLHQCTHKLTAEANAQAQKRTECVKNKIWRNVPDKWKLGTR